MKVNGNGQAKVLDAEELRSLFSQGLLSPRDRALFGICLYTGCRISEALALTLKDVQGGVITFRKQNTKGKLKTRSVDMAPALAELLKAHCPKPGFLFPGMHGRGHLSRFMAERLLKTACDRVGLVGVSTHSFRRTALTQMSSAGVPLRHIQEISGHDSLANLQKYLEVTADQKRNAVAAIGF
jgi:integrase/recombinase XerD